MRLVWQGRTGAWGEEEVEAEAQSWAEKLHKTFGLKLAKNPTIAARALEIYSPRLVHELADWFQAAKDDEEIEDGELDNEAEDAA